MEPKNSIDTDHSDTTRTTENSRHLTWFCSAASEVIVRNNIVYNTVKTEERKGAGVLAKHAIPGCKFTVENNRFAGMGFYAIGTSGPADIAGNLIIDSEASFSLKDHGGPNVLQDIYIGGNTSVNSGGVVLSPLSGIPDYPPNNIDISDNVFHDARPEYSQNNAFHNIGTYAPEEVKLLTDEKREFNMDNNCVFNSNAEPLSNYFLRAGGGVLTPTQWMALSGFDRNSYYGDPQLDSGYAATSPFCADKGYAAPEETPVPEVTISGCDYTDAPLNGGWGWNSGAGVSCPPKETPVPEVTISGCDYTDAPLNGGWGWNSGAGVSCPPEG